MVVNAIDEIINFGKVYQLDLILGGRAHFMHMYVVCDESYHRLTHNWNPVNGGDHRQAMKERA